MKSPSLKKAKSGPAKTWEQLVKNERHMLVKAWNSKDPQKSFSNKIQKLHKKYTSAKGTRK